MSAFVGDEDDVFGNPFGEPTVPAAAVAATTTTIESSLTVSVDATSPAVVQGNGYYADNSSPAVINTGTPVVGTVQHTLDEEDAATEDVPVTTAVPIVSHVQQYDRLNTCPYESVVVTEPELVDNSYMLYKVKVVLSRGERAIVNQRRFRDFFWLMTQLIAKYPGVIVPPTPEKREIGKFRHEFVEHRRAALEAMLKRIISHPILVGASDVRLFLESENLDTVVDPSVRASAGRKGFFGLLGSAISPPVTKVQLADDDPWFETKKKQIDQLGVQLQSLHMRVEQITKHRKELGSSVSNFWDSISQMGTTADMLSPVFASMAHLGGIQQKVEDINLRLSSQYMDKYGITVEEYIRLLESVRLVLAVRDRYVAELKSSHLTLQRKQARLDALVAQNKGDVAIDASKEVTDKQRHVKSCQDNVDDISALLREELTRFEHGLTRDFQECTKTFAQTMRDGQKEALGWWEQYKPEFTPSSSS